MFRNSIKSAVNVSKFRRCLFSSTALRSELQVTKGIVSPMLSVPTSIPYPEYAHSGQPYTKSSDVVYYEGEDIPKLRKAARLARKILEFGLNAAKPGMSTDEVDRLCHEEMIKHGAYPSPLNYFYFPKSICTSVNEVICHGIPDSRILKEGDLLSIDVSLYIDGFHGDNCGSRVVGDEKKADEKMLKLIQTTKDSVMKAIEVCKPGNCITQIGKTIEKYAHRYDYDIVNDFCGHGVGKYLHMQPLILHFGNEDKFMMRPGMVFTIEPILTEGSGEIFTWPDQWTAATRDGGWGAQIEHEVLITEDGCEVLTVLE